MELVKSLLLIICKVGIICKGGDCAGGQIQLSIINVQCSIVINYQN